MIIEEPSKGRRIAYLSNRLIKRDWEEIGRVSNVVRITSQKLGIDRKIPIIYLDDVRSLESEQLEEALERSNLTTQRVIQVIS